MHEANRYTWVWMLPLILLAFWLGLRMLNFDIFWFDEIRALDYSSLRNGEPRPLGSLIDWLMRHKWQSPAYYIYLSYWGQVFGWEHFGGRMSALVLGIVALAWMYRLGRDMFSPRMGVYAAMMLLGSSLYIYYLHEMRPYTLYLLLTIISIWAYWNIIKVGDKARVPIILYVALFLGFTGLAYTHAMALLTPLAIGVYHVLFAPKNKRWLITFGVMALAGLAALPWIWVSLGISDRAGVDIARIDRALYGIEIPQTLFYAFGNGYILLPLVLVFLAAFDKRDAARFTMVLGIVIIAAAMAISYLVPALIHIKYVMAAWPVLALLCAIGVRYQGIRNVPVVVILVIWLATGIITSLNTNFYDALPNSDPALPREGIEQFVGIVESAAHPDDVIVMHTSRLNWEGTTGLVHGYYFRNTAAESTHLQMVHPAIIEADEALYMQAVADYMREVPVVWTGILHKIPQTFRVHAFFKQLETSHAHCQDIISDRDDFEAALYARLDPQREAASFGDNEVEVQMLWDVPSQVSDNLDVLIGYDRHPDVPPDTYSVSIQVVNADGMVVQQADYGLSNEVQSCQWSSFDMNTLPTGDYTVHVAIYNWQTLERMPADSEAENDSVVIGQFRVIGD